MLPKAFILLILYFSPVKYALKKPNEKLVKAIKEKYNKLIYYIEKQKTEIIVSPFLKDAVVKVQQFL